jgi:CheY-like chemotaxis protein
LTVKGYQARVAHDGPGALVTAEAFRPAVAILDLGLPVMDGYELATRLRELPHLRDIKLVAVTGYGQESDRRKTRRAGFRHHLVKPVDLRRVEQVLAGSAVEEDGADQA